MNLAVFLSIIFEMESIYDVRFLPYFAREVPFFLLLFRHFFWVLGAIFQKKIDECIFLPFMEKSFPGKNLPFQINKPKHNLFM